MNIYVELVLSGAEENQIIWLLSVGKVGGGDGTSLAVTGAPPDLPPQLICLQSA